MSDDPIRDLRQCDEEIRRCAEYEGEDRIGATLGDIDNRIEKRIIWESLGLKPYYDEDGIVIFHGDCREILPRLPKVVGCPQIICITDPPYGIALSNHARGKERRDMDWTIRNDATQECGEYVLSMLGRIPTLAFASPMRPWPGKWRQHLVWEKGEHVSGGGDPATCWKPSWELLQTRNTGALNGSRDGAVLRFLAEKDDYALHPTPKPISLLCYLIAKVSRPGDLILDPFMGSGTTLVAAKQLGRRAIGIEICEAYCEIAVKRLAQQVFDFGNSQLNDGHGERQMSMLDAMTDPAESPEVR